MRTFPVIVALACCCIFQGVAQEEPIPPKRSRMVKVGLFGGFTPGMLFPDLKPINDFLKGGKGAALKEGGVFLWGGAGAAYIMLVPNLRVGGVGMNGSIKSSSVDAAGVRRDAELGVGYGGVTIEYVIPIVERFDFAVGTMLGAGGIDLTLRQSSGGTNTWQGEQTSFGNTPGSATINATRVLSGSFFVFIPSACVEYSMLNWLALRVGVSYVGMAAPSWSVDGKYDLLGVPSGVSGRGVMVNAGLLVGTF
ncbi:MAG: hypothetical protein AB1428_04330 [Bacteroidota bacterium]